VIAAAMLAVLTGAIPLELAAPARVVWIADAPAETVTCGVSAAEWFCGGIPDGARGIVVILGANGIAFAITGQPGAAISAFRSWGRAVAIQRGAVSDTDLARAKASVWSPERSRIRANTTRLTATIDAAVDVLPVAPGLFWVAGNDTDADAFVVVDGGEFAVTRVPISSLRDGNVEVPLLVAPALASVLIGRVEDARGDDVDATDVELFELLQPPRSSDDDRLLERPMVRVGLVTTGTDGSFAFTHLGEGPFVVSITDATRGRTRMVVPSAGRPVTLRLTPPSRARGRVLSQRMPVSSARVRLVPDPQQFIAASDARDLASLDVVTGVDGRFVLTLPPIASGVVQVVAPDGRSVRVPLPGRSGRGDIELGDISLSEARRLTIRVAAASGCVLSAVGPAGMLGLSVVREAGVMGIVHWLDLPEAGQWSLDAECDGRLALVEPATVLVDAAGPPPIVDARIVR